MKKNPSRWITLLLALMIVVAGCSQGSGRQSAKEQPAAEDKTTEEQPASGSNEPVKVTAFSEQGARIISYNDNLMTQKIEEKLGIDLEFQTAPSDGAKDKQNLLLASGDYPAAFIGGDFTKVEQLKYGSLGVLVPLNDLIEKYGPNIKKAFEDNPALKDGVTAPDGNIYALPGLDGCWHCYWPAKTWMNEEWLKTLNLEMPATTEEFEKVLLAFKNDDPNGNGIQDEIPLSGFTSSGGDWGNPITFLMNAFVYTDPVNYLQVKDGKVDIVADNEEWKQGLQYIKKLYDQGLIDPQTFTQNQESLQQVAMNPEAIILGIYANLWNGDVVTIYEEAVDQRWNQYVAVPPLKGPNGVQYATYTGHKIPNGKFAITDKATEEQAIAAIKVADYLYTPEGALDAFQGVDQVTWVWAKEGQIGTDGKQAVYAKPEGLVSNWDEPTKGLWENGFYYMSVKLFHGRAVANRDPETQSGNEVRLYNDNLKYAGKEPGEGTRLPDIFIDPNSAQEVAELSTVINSYIKQNAVQFVIGQRSLDNEWDSYVQGLQDMNAARYLEIYQAAYDANANK